MDALRRLALLAVVLAALGWGWPLPATAQEAASDEAATSEAATSEPGTNEAAEHGAASDNGEAADHAEGDDHGGGMPQLDVGTYPSQIFWLVLTFGLLYWLLKRKALPRVAEILETRQERVAADLDRAAQLRREAEEAYEQYERIVAEAQNRAQAQLRQTREQMNEDFAKRQAKLDADLAKKVRDAEKRIDEARQAAMGELETVAIETAQAATQRLIGVEIDKDRARAALGQVREAA